MSSDSDSDFLTNSCQNQRHESTLVRATGPNVTTISKYGSNRWANQDYQRLYPAPRSMYSYRDTSSVKSLSDWPRRDLQHSSYNSGIRNFMTNGRCTSPGSVRSTGSNISCMTVDDITTALKTSKFSKQEWKMIGETYKKYTKSRINRKRAKRMNLRRFLKGGRDVTGGDSGDQASSSSISSDDCRSTRTGITMLRGYKRTTSSYNTAYRPHSRITDKASTSRINVNSIKRTIKDNSIYSDSTNVLHNKSVLPSKYLNRITTNQNDVSHSTKVSEYSNLAKNSSLLSCERFKKPLVPPLHRPNLPNGLSDKQINIGSKSFFLLPTQRFNKSTVSNTIVEENEKKQPNTDLQNLDLSSDSSERNVNNIDELKIISSGSKRKASESFREEHSNSKKSRKIAQRKEENDRKNTPHKDREKSDNFEFAKPSFPVSKYLDLKNEKIIAQSHPQIHPVKPSCSKSNSTVDPALKNLDSDKLLNSTNDVSSRPSFLKRKLFTQTLDITEIKNISNDNSLDSPTSNIYSDSIKDKSKARKLVPGQSCLIREVSKDNSLLDLLQQIMPNDQKFQNMNKKSKQVENATPAKEIVEKGRNTFDVISILSNCNEEQTSDTFTDEEIFVVKPKSQTELERNTTVAEKLNEKPINKSIPLTTSAKALLPNKEASVLKTRNKVIIDKNVNECNEKKEICPKNSKELPQVSKQFKQQSALNPSVILEKATENNMHDTTKRKLSAYVKSFWDSESEWETPNNTTVQYVGNNKGVSTSNDVSRKPLSGLTNTVDSHLSQMKMSKPTQAAAQASKTTERNRKNKKTTKETPSQRKNNKQNISEQSPDSSINDSKRSTRIKELKLTKNGMLADPKEIKTPVKELSNKKKHPSLNSNQPKASKTLSKSKNDVKANRILPRNCEGETSGFEDEIKSILGTSVMKKVTENNKYDTTKRKLSCYLKSFWDSESEWENPCNNNTVQNVPDKKGESSSNDASRKPLSGLTNKLDNHLSQTKKTKPTQIADKDSKTTEPKSKNNKPKKTTNGKRSQQKINVQIVIENSVDSSMNDSRRSTRIKELNLTKNGVLAGPKQRKTAVKEQIKQKAQPNLNLNQTKASKTPCKNKNNGNGKSTGKIARNCGQDEVSKLGGFEDDMKSILGTSVMTRSRRFKLQQLF